MKSGDAAANLLYGVHWQGGVIPHSDFDKDEHLAGCVAGALTS
jgi:hypothetical protein